MRPLVISPTIQQFNGVRYYLCGNYFQHKGERLHLAVWKYHRGPVPAGYHVHHKNNDRTDNTIGNLECLTVREHLGGRHGKEYGKRARRFLPVAQTAAAAWHASEEGRRWHSQHYEQHIRPVMELCVPAICEQCGDRYPVSAGRIKQGKFCSPKCKARAFRRRRRGL